MLEFFSHLDTTKTLTSDQLFGTNGKINLYTLWLRKPKTWLLLNFEGQ